MTELTFFDKVYYHQTIGSTFTEAKRLISKKMCEGNFIVIADIQTEGVGRKGNDWFSPQGGLWFTAGLYNLPVRNCITIFTALMIVRAIIKLYPQTEEHIGVKWPNDVFLDGKKLGGILTSFFPMMNYLLIGVGINTTNKGFPQSLNAISLIEFFEDYCSSGLLASKVDNHLIVDEIFNQFGESLPAYIDESLKSFFDDYYLYSVLEGKTISLKTEFQDFRGVVKGINREGALLLELSNGSIQPFLNGTVISD